MIVSLPTDVRRGEWILKVAPPKLTSMEFELFCAENPDLRLEMMANGDIVLMDLVGGMDSHRNFTLTGRFGEWSRIDGTGVGFASCAGLLCPTALCVHQIFLG